MLETSRRLHELVIADGNGGYLTRQTLKLGQELVIPSGEGHSDASLLLEGRSLFELDSFRNLSILNLFTLLCLIVEVHH